MTASRSEIRILLGLAGPVMLTQLGQMSLGIVDTVFIGHVSVSAMAAASLANAYAWISMMSAAGVIIGMDPLVSQAHGAGDAREVALTLQRGLLLGLGLSLFVMLAWHFAGNVLVLAGQKPQLAAQAQLFLDSQLWSVPCFPTFMALRQYLQGRGLVSPAMWTIALTNLVNVVFNWALVFGHLGCPALGLRGAGIASGLANVFMLLALTTIVFALQLQREAWQPWSRACWEPAGMWRIVKIGLPIGAQFGLEVAAFSWAAMMAGWLGERAVSAHTICLNFAALTFMLPLGISIGASTRVGNLIGEGDQDAARRTSTLALQLGVSVMACCALLLSLLRTLIPRAYTPDTEVIALAALIFPIVAGFQIADGTQVVCTGVLRGIGRTRAPAVSHFVGYYCLGLPAGYLLAFRAGLGVTGIWWGLLIGLTGVAVLQFAWLQRALRKPLQRLAAATSAT